MFRRFFEIWFVISLLFGWEYLALNRFPNYSLLYYLSASGIALMETDLTTGAGRPFSYALGWIGFAIILLTNPYILRKKLSFMGKWGRLNNWLYFHIFCGLMGPTLIIFHTDFKVRGLVAISFWSMMIVAVSGILGRYFFVQAGKETARLGKNQEKWSLRFDKMVEASKAAYKPEQVVGLKMQALVFAGGYPNSDGASPIFAFFRSIAGDIRILYSLPKTFSGLPPESRYVLLNYALSARQKQFVTHFKKLLSYWHSFHIPFAFIMYITAIIHIVSALLFKV